MRVAVIGAGGIGSLHASLLSGIGGVEEVLVVDTDASRASAVSPIFSSARPRYLCSIPGACSAA